MRMGGVGHAPPEADSTGVADVAIVGAGPVGALAANLCGVHGLSAVAFDREHDVYDLPRAVGMWDDVQRILYNAGVFEAVLPATCVHVGAEFVDPTGRRLIGIDIPDGFLTPNGFPLVRGFHQPLLEAAVRQRLARYDAVRLYTGHEVIAIEPTADHVSIVVHDREGGARRTVRARWLIGCDGASSFVRKFCGIGWNSLGYDHDWLVVDLALRSGVELPQHCVQVCDPGRPTTMLPLPLRMHRWEFQLRAGESREEMESPERVWALLGRWVAPADAEIVRAVVYRFHATIAETFRCGRVFLAGDAAHQTPPFMGQGMCTGIRDVDNLIWKLALVRRGLAGDGLLDTYTEERHPMAIAMVEHSVKTGQLIDAFAAMCGGGPEPPRELREYGYGGRAQLPHLATGLLAGGNSPWIGQAVPQCTVVTDDGGGRFDDVVGPRWALIAAGDPLESMSTAWRQYWTEIGAAFVRVPEPEGTMLGLLDECRNVVARPDRIVYGVGPDCFDPAPLRSALGVGGAAGACTGQGSRR